MLLPLQGVNAMIIRVTQGAASLALGYALLPFQGVHYRVKNHAENGVFCRTSANFLYICCKDKVFLLKKPFYFLQT